MQRASVLFLTWMLVGCGSSEPEEPETTADLGTGEIIVGVSAKGNGEAVLLTASVASTRQGSRVLAETDRLVASAADAAELTLSEYDTFRYAALLPTRQASVTLSLIRPSERVSADIQLPDPFALTVPPGTVSAMAAIPIAWEAAQTGDTMALEVSGSCVSPLTRSLTTDTGSYEIQPGDLTFDEPGCALAVSLARSRPSGPLPLAANESKVSVAQVRTAAVEVTQ